MGLDLELNLIVKDKLNKNAILEQPIAYWRNHYTMRDKLVEIFDSYDDFIIERDEDYRIIVTEPIYCLKSIISFISKSIPNEDDPIFTDSIWGAGVARLQTISNLKRICKWQSSLSIINSFNSGVISLPDMENIKYEKIFLNFIKNKSINDLDFVLELVNSY